MNIRSRKVTIVLAIVFVVCAVTIGFALQGKAYKVKYTDPAGGEKNVVIDPHISIFFKGNAPQQQLLSAKSTPESQLDIKRYADYLIVVPNKPLKEQTSYTLMLSLKSGWFIDTTGKRTKRLQLSFSTGSGEFSDLAQIPEEKEVSQADRDEIIKIASYVGENWDVINNTLSKKLKNYTSYFTNQFLKKIYDANSWIEKQNKGLPPDPIPHKPEKVDKVEITSVDSQESAVEAKTSKRSLIMTLKRTKEGWRVDKVDETVL